MRGGRARHEGGVREAAQRAEQRVAQLRRGRDAEAAPVGRGQDGHASAELELKPGQPVPGRVDFYAAINSEFVTKITN